MYNQKRFAYISIVIIALILIVGTGYYYLALADKTPSLTITSPKHGESLEIGKTYDIAWKSKNIDKISFYLVRQGQTDVALTMGQNTQASLKKYSWTIPADNKDISIGGQFQICVFADNNYLPITCGDWFGISKKLANWKNYTNSKYNYQISYPENVYTIENITYNPEKETTDDNVTLYDISSVQETKKCECGEYMAIHINAYSNPQGLSLENYIKENIKNWASDYSNLFINEQTSLNGIPAIKIGTEREQYYILEKNNVIFSIGRFIDMNVISTFKFISEEVSNNEMVNWKTYTDNKLGIEFKYPADLIKDGDWEDHARLSRDPDFFILFGVSDINNNCSISPMDTVLKSQKFENIGIIFDKIVSVGRMAEGTLAYDVHYYTTKENKCFYFYFVKEFGPNSWYSAEKFPDSLLPYETFDAIISTFKFVD